MKKLFFIFTVLMLCVTACTNSNDEIAYSCNPKINKWAKNNLEEIQTMSRSEWLAMEDVKYQRAALAAFTPEQKLEFWLLRFDEILQLPWTEKETLHIKEVIDLLQNNAYIFQNDYSDEKIKEFEIALYKWCEKGINELGWDKKVIAALIADGHRMTDTKGNLEIPMQKMQMMQTRAEELPDCNCKKENVLWTTCGRNCEDLPCEEIVHNCGFFTVESCNGICVL